MTERLRLGIIAIYSKLSGQPVDIHEALTIRNSNRHLAELDDSMMYELYPYMTSADDPKASIYPDSVLVRVRQIVRRAPGLKYAPHVTFFTFSALLRTDPHLACDYGKAVLKTVTYDDPTYDAIIYPINNLGSQKLPPEVYRLGAGLNPHALDVWHGF